MNHEEQITSITTNELIDTLSEMIKNFESLPPHAMIQPVNHYDLMAFMLLMQSILKSMQR